MFKRETVENDPVILDSYISLPKAKEGSLTHTYLYSHVHWLAPYVATGNLETLLRLKAPVISV